MILQTLTIMSFTDNKNLASLRFKNGGSIIHHLTSRNDCARLRKVLQAFDDQQRQNILSHMNTSGKTALETAKPYEVRQLLAWSSSQEGFYYLPTPPVVLIMYSTEDRQGAEEERMELSKVFPDFNVDVRERRDLRKQQMLDEIRMAQMKDDISALIVIIMSHGVHGAVCASDGDVRIQDILRQMCAPFLQGKPKVRTIFTWSLFKLHVYTITMRKLTILITPPIDACSFSIPQVLMVQACQVPGETHTSNVRGKSRSKTANYPLGSHAVCFVNYQH